MITPLEQKENILSLEKLSETIKLKNFSEDRVYVVSLDVITSIHCCLLESEKHLIELKNFLSQSVFNLFSEERKIRLFDDKEKMVALVDKENYWKYRNLWFSPTIKKMIRLLQKKGHLILSTNQPLDNGNVYLALFEQGINLMKERSEKEKKLIEKIPGGVSNNQKEAYKVIKEMYQEIYVISLEGESPFFSHQGVNQIVIKQTPDSISGAEVCSYASLQAICFLAKGIIKGDDWAQKQVKLIEEMKKKAKT